MISLWTFSINHILSWTFSINHILSWTFSINHIPIMNILNKSYSIMNMAWLKDLSNSDSLILFSASRPVWNAWIEIDYKYEISSTVIHCGYYKDYAHKIFYKMVHPKLKISHWKKFSGFFIFKSYSPSR